MSFFSSPLGLMCGTKPLAFAVSSFPTYAASRQRFCRVSFVAGSTIRPFSSGSRETLSWRLAPVTTSDKGTPFSSTRRFRFVPFFSPVRRVRPDGLLRQRRLDVRSAGRLPDPANSLHLIVLGQPAPPKFLKEPGRSPVLELAVECRRPKALELLPRQSVPDEARAQHIDDRGEIQTIGILRLSSAPRLAFILKTAFDSCFLTLNSRRISA